MKTYQEYLQATKKLLKVNKQGGIHQAQVLDREFLASPNVFSPRYFKDTEIFARNLPIKSGEDFLEIGCGIGAIGITAAFKGATKVVMTDINPAAVGVAKRNVQKHGLQKIVKVRRGSLYDPLYKGELFDSIFWNTPFGFVRKQRLTMLERAVFDPGYSFTKRFIQQGSRHLKPGGRLIIGFSTTLGKIRLLERFCEMEGLQLRLLYRERSKEIYPVNFELYEARR